MTDTLPTDIESQLVTNHSQSDSISVADQEKLDKVDDDSDEPLLPPMGLNKQLPSYTPDRDEFTVTFNGDDDPLFPHNWPLRKKVFLFIVILIDTLAATWGSSSFSTASAGFAQEFYVGTEVGILGSSLFIVGFATGPVIWAPLSELYGRRKILILSCLGFTLFLFGSATGKDIQTVLLTRAFGGILGAAPLVVVPLSYADMFGDQTRGTLITIFSVVSFITPIFSPVVNSFVASSYLGWRWTQYLTGILGALSLVLLVLFFKETHHPIILVEKLNYLKKRTNNWAIHAEHDEFSLSMREIVEDNIARPLKMLFTDPIICLLSLYNAFVFGILYLLLSAYPVVFAEGYKMSMGVSSLPFFAVMIGMAIGGAYDIWDEKRHLKTLAQTGEQSVPESRLPAMFIGAFTFPIGLFWFTWTGNYSDKVHWMLPTAAGVFIGFGLLTIFNGCLNYIVDSYLQYLASAMAANAFLRALWACAFPLFGTQMFHGMGTNWAGLLLTCVAFLLTPMPFLFYKYGAKIRSKSKYISI